MTKVKELIEQLKKCPEDMIIGINRDPYYDIEVSKRTWIDSNYPYDKPDFEYLNIE